MPLTTPSFELESQRLGFGYQVDDVVDALIDVEEGIPLTAEAQAAITKTDGLIRLTRDWDESSAMRPRFSAALFYSTAIPRSVKSTDDMRKVTESVRRTMGELSDTLASVVRGEADLSEVARARGFFEAVAEEALREQEIKRDDEETGFE